MTECPNPAAAETCRPDDCWICHEEKGEVRMRHDPTYLSAHRVSWARCTCGWSSLRHPTTGSAAIDFANHLAAVTEESA